MTSPFDLLVIFIDVCTYLNVDRAHEQTLVPCLVMNKNMDGVQQMAHLMQKNRETLLSQCIPNILIHILPLFAAKKMPALTGDKLLHKKVPHATECYDLVTAIVTEQVTSTL